MGRITVQLELANNDDVKAVKKGQRRVETVRRAEIDGIIDTGATRLVLPQSVVEQLGLTPVGQVKVRYANNRKATRPLVEDVRLRLQGREGTFEAIVEPKRNSALVGAIVLESLDLVVDCTKQRLHPRDPDWIISEIE